MGKISFGASPAPSFRWGSLKAKKALLGYIFILPWIIGFIWFQAGPILASLFLSFSEYNILSPPNWIGLSNFIRSFTKEPLFWKSLFNTVYYVGFSVPLGLVMGFTVALLLNTKIRGMTIYRSIFYMPAIVPSVGSAILWLWLFHGGRGGLLNMALGIFKLGPIDWLGEEATSKPSLIIMSLWGIGGGMIIYLAGLQGIPRQLYEAAEVDGASWLQKLLHITIPMMTPTIFFNLIMGIINSFQVFNAAFIMTRGGPLNSTYFYMLYLYDSAFSYFEMGYASSLAWILFIIIMALTLLAFKTSGRWVFYE
ncbi:MAG: carbohydrate ABC transporter permease [bacterium]